MPHNDEEYKYKLGHQGNVDIVLQQHQPYLKALQTATQEILNQNPGMTSVPFCGSKQIAAIVSSNPKNDNLPGITPAGICYTDMSGPTSVENLFTTLGLKEALLNTSDGKGLFLPLTENIKKARDQVMIEFEKISVTITPCKFEGKDFYAQPFANAQRVLIFFTLETGCRPGSSTCHYQWSATDPTLGTKYFNLIGVREGENIDSIMNDIAHEIGHAMGFCHSMPFGKYYAGCALEYLNHIPAMQALMAKHQCTFDTHQETSPTIMRCVSGVVKKFEFSPADKLMFKRRFLYLTTGDKRHLFPPAIESTTITSSPASNKMELMLLPGYAGPMVDSSEGLGQQQLSHATTAIAVRETSPEGLRQRQVPTKTTAIAVRETLQQCPQDQPIAQQIDYRGLTTEVFNAFACSFSLALANQLLQYQRFNGIDKKALEVSLNFIIMAIFYGIPMAAFSINMEYAVEQLLVYIQKQDNRHSWLIPYLKPLLPILLNTLYAFYQSRGLLDALRIPLNFVSSIVGTFLGKSTAQNWFAKFMYNSSKKED